MHFMELSGETCSGGNPQKIHYHLTSCLVCDTPWPRYGWYCSLSCLERGLNLAK
jgi:hypothetical protein